MTYHLFAVSDEWQAEERRCRRAEIERIARSEEALALAGYGSMSQRARSGAARLLVRVAMVLDARSGGNAPRATARQV